MNLNACGMFHSGADQSLVSAWGKSNYRDNFIHQILSRTYLDKVCKCENDDEGNCDDSDCVNEDGRNEETVSVMR